VGARNKSPTPIRYSLT